MIEESGTVVAIGGSDVWVQTIRRSTCGSCSARKGCGQGLLARVSDGRANQVRVRNTCGADVGDRVVLGIEESQLLRASLLVYAVPLATLLVGTLMGDGLWPGEDLAAILGGGAGLAVGFLLVKRMSVAAGRLQPLLLRKDPHRVPPQPLEIRGSGMLNS